MSKVLECLESHIDRRLENTNYSKQEILDELSDIEESLKSLNNGEISNFIYSMENWIETTRVLELDDSYEEEL